MVRTILTPDNTHIEFDIPEEYVGRKLEITYHALDEEPKTANKTMGDFLGILSKESGDTIQAEILKMRGEWNRNI